LLLGKQKRGAGLAIRVGMETSRYPVKVSEKKREELQRSVGLCADCRFMRPIESDRGSTFYLCERSATDARFPKYPRLPVLRCLGHEPLSAEGERPEG
jgi:hypothetical protein